MGRVGGINAGMSAHASILEALLFAGRGRSSRERIEISLFSTIAELMTLPLLPNDYGKGPRK